MAVLKLVGTLNFARGRLMILCTTGPRVVTADFMINFGIEFNAQDFDGADNIRRSVFSRFNAMNSVILCTICSPSK